MRRTLITICVTGLFASGLLAVAQNKDNDSRDAMMVRAMEAYATPGDEQKWLSKLTGEWVAKASFRMAPDIPWQDSDAMVARHMEFDGRYLVEKYSSMMMGMPFRGRATTGWDNALQKFVTTWCDNMGTGITHGTGQWNSEKTQIDWTITQADPMTGTLMRNRATWTFSPGTMHLDSFMKDLNGKEFHAMRISYRRPMPMGWDPNEAHGHDHPKGDHPKGDHPKGDHPKVYHPKGDHPKADHQKCDHTKGDHPK